jgi:molybdopterin/thiamine biosynthesis adenylyltransferase
MRHSGWAQPDNFAGETLNVIGCGAVGSNFAAAAARVGFHNFHLVDFDHVEAHNLANQAFDEKHISSYKTKALEEILLRINGAVTVTTSEEALTESNLDALPPGPICLFVDSVEARREIVEALEKSTKHRFLVETRLSFYEGEVNFCILSDDKSYEEFVSGLPSREFMEEAPCGLRLCTPLVLVVVGVLVSQLTEYYRAKANSEPWKLKQKTVIGLRDSEPFAMTCLKKEHTFS